MAHFLAARCRKQLVFGLIAPGGAQTIVFDELLDFNETISL